MRRDRHTRVSERAYFEWLSKGQPHGQDQADWFRAEAAESKAEISTSTNGKRGSRRARSGWPPTLEALRKVRKHLARQAGENRDDLDRIIRKLAQFYSAEKIEPWLIAPHPLLHGERAIDLINAGRTNEVLSVIQGLEDGIYT